MILFCCFALFKIILRARRLHIVAEFLEKNKNDRSKILEALKPAAGTRGKEN